MRRILATALVVSASGAARAQPATEPDASPVRQGLMIELDGGIGGTYLSEPGARPDGTPEAVRKELGLYGFGIGGIDAGIGVFATPELALLVRFSSETYFESLPATNKIHAQSTLGPAAEWWISDRLFAGVGVGIGIEGGQEQSGANSEHQFGYGVTARTGWAVASTPESAWRISVETDAAFLIGGRRAYTGSLLIGWTSF